MKEREVNMKISAKMDYACRALLELALHWPGETPMQISEIARRQKIPMKFLVHIMIHLKERGYVNSVRGNKGGYVLAKAPAEIHFGDVIKDLGGLGEEKKLHRKLHTLELVWQEIDEDVRKIMDAVTLDTICTRERSKGKALTYDI